MHATLPLVGADQPATPRSSTKRVAAASLAGTTLEFYDHFIYGSAAALVFPKLFFPQSEPLVATLLSFASYGVAFVARPLGAAVFGHFGDKLGRKSILFLTLLMMGLATFLIGCLPTFGQVGLLAPVLLVLLRIVQGLALGGEWGGAASSAPWCRSPPRSACCWPTRRSPSSSGWCRRKRSWPGAGACRS